MIVYKSMISSSRKERKKPFPYRTEFNDKSLIVAGISTGMVILAFILG